MNFLILEINLLLSDYYLYSEKVRNYHEKLFLENPSLSTSFYNQFVQAKVKINEIKKILNYLNVNPVAPFDEPLSEVPLKEEELLTISEQIASVNESQQSLIKQLETVQELARQERFHLLVRFTGETLIQLRKNCTIGKKLKKAI